MQGLIHRVDECQEPVFRAAIMGRRAILEVLLEAGCSLDFCLTGRMGSNAFRYLLSDIREDFFDDEFDSDLDDDEVDESLDDQATVEHYPLRDFWDIHRRCLFRQPWIRNRMEDYLHCDDLLHDTSPGASSPHPHPPN